MLRLLTATLIFAFSVNAFANRSLEKCPEAEEIRALFLEKQSEMTGFEFVADENGKRYIYAHNAHTEFYSIDAYSFDWVQLKSDEEREAVHYTEVYYDLYPLKRRMDPTGVDAETGARLMRTIVAEDVLTGLDFYLDARASCEDLKIASLLIEILSDKKK